MITNIIPYSPYITTIWGSLPLNPKPLNPHKTCSTSLVPIFDQGFEVCCAVTASKDEHGSSTPDLQTCVRGYENTHMG